MKEHDLKAHETTGKFVLSYILILTFYITGEKTKIFLNQRLRSTSTPRSNQKKGVSWDVTPCGSCKNRRFGGI
jgi:hypothetical protein